MRVHDAIVTETTGVSPKQYRMLLLKEKQQREEAEMKKKELEEKLSKYEAELNKSKIGFLFLQPHYTLM